MPTTILYNEKGCDTLYMHDARGLLGYGIDSPVQLEMQT